MDWQQSHQHYNERINQKLQALVDSLPNHAPQLKQAMSYSLLMGGKRIRPYLVYAVGEACGADVNDLDICALAVECIHAYSLIHDDLPAMDDDDLRRGQPTCHIAFDEATAILAGDALQTLAFETIACATMSAQAQNKQVALLKVLTQASGYRGMCGGQAIDLDSTDKAIDLATLQQLHRLKTAALIQAAVEMAAIVSGLSEHHIQALRDYSDAIGLAFQVQDDILDVTADTQTLGKPQGSDTEANKSTYPSLLGLAQAQAEAQRLYHQALQALETLPYNTQNLQSFAAYIVKRDH